MNEATAAEIADLINTHNQLAKRYFSKTVQANADRYIMRLRDGHVIGAIEVKQVQWYQCEVLHLSVAPAAQGRGIGAGLIEEAEARARSLGARIAQCTIRVGNAASEAVFSKRGFIRTATFHNTTTHNDVAVYQKVL